MLSVRFITCAIRPPITPPDFITLPRSKRSFTASLIAVPSRISGPSIRAESAASSTGSITVANTLAPMGRSPQVNSITAATAKAGAAR